jgi:hypothetical protein
MRLHFESFYDFVAEAYHQKERARERERDREQARNKERDKESVSHLAES